MRTKRASVVAGAAAALLLGLFPAAAAPAAHADTSAIDSALQHMHWVVNVGPGHATQCTIDGGMYVPKDASPTHRVPAVIVAHGFGLNYTYSEAVANYFYNQDYAVLVYSGLGFGQTGCGTGFGDPQWDGATASQLIDYLGGDAVPASMIDANGNATAAPPRTDILHDAVDHDGVARPDDPRVGMIGESLGAGVQFSAASIDHRIDALVPIGAWNNLNYSLTPDNADLASDSDLLSTTPGTPKNEWTTLFQIQSLVYNNPTNYLCPIRAAGTICPDLLASTAQGYATPAVAAVGTASAVSTYGTKLITPTLLVYGEEDDLMNLKEAIANYRQLQGQGTPVKMIWTGGSHLDGIKGDMSLTAPDTGQYAIQRISNWMEHYLKGDGADTGPTFAYLRQWLIQPTGDNTPQAVNAAYATSDTVDIPATAHTWYLSAGGNLVDNAGALGTDLQGFASGLSTPVSTFLASIGWIATGMTAGANYPDFPNIGGVATQWSTPALTAPVTVVGEPTVDVRLASPTVAGNIASHGVGGMMTGVAKLYDISPNGTATLVNDQSVPFRVSDTTKTVHVVFPPLTHQFPAGDKIQLVISGFDYKYGGSQVVNASVIFSGDTGQGLTLPTVG